jgi:hypothetical protein
VRLPLRNDPLEVEPFGHVEEIRPPSSIVNTWGTTVLVAATR